MSKCTLLFIFVCFPVITMAQQLPRELRKVPNSISKQTTSYPYDCAPEPSRKAIQMRTPVRCDSSLFHRSAFLGSTDLAGGIFESTGDFRWASFGKDVNFGSTKFKQNATFLQANFGGLANFFNAEFDEYALFSGANFRDSASFNHAVFRGLEAEFYKSNFDSLAEFLFTSFQGTADFRHGRFKDAVSFENTTFMRDANFFNTSFDSTTDFNLVTFGDTTNFEQATFYQDASFQDANFGHIASFYDATFRGGTNFREATLPTQLDFSNVDILTTSIVDFTYAELDSSQKVVNPHFRSLIALQGTDVSKVKINMELFKLWFPYATTTYEQKIEVYEKVLANFERDGLIPSYKILDIEYQQFVNQYEGKYLADFVQRYVWNYGHNKEYIVYWLLLFGFLTVTYRRWRAYKELKKTKPNVFISYRRSDTMHIAQTISETLIQAFGTSSIFFDVDTIPGGVDFREHIASFIDRSNVLIVIIGDNWLEERRIDQPNDFVRLEIELALQSGISIIPVLVEELEMPSANELPDSIKKIAFLQAVSIQAGKNRRQQLDYLVGEVRKLFGE